MRVGLRGPEGIRQRMAEIQAKLDRAFPEATREVFSGAMASATGSPLAGAIGGHQPLDPRSLGLQLSPSAGATEFRPMIEAAAKEAGIDPELLDALVAVESNYDPRARSHAGAMGLTQLMEGTARELGVHDRMDPGQSLRGGATYLARMLQRFGGDVKLALAAYNAGPGAVEKFNGIPPYAETQKYVERVTELYRLRTRP